MKKALNLKHFIPAPESGETLVPKRIPIPVAVQQSVALSMLSDPRPASKRPRLIDIYLQMAINGLEIMKAEFDDKQDYFISDKDLKNVSITADVFWIPESVNEDFKSLLAAVNSFRQAKGESRVRSVVPLICAAIRKGHLRTPVKMKKQQA